MHPSFEQFVSALRDPSQRASIGLTISDADASALLTRHDWATDYYHQWLAMFPTAAADANASAAAAQPVDPAGAFGPPPGAPPAYGVGQFAATQNSAAQHGTPQYGATQYDAPVQLGSASRMPSGLKRLLIIGGSVIGAVLLVVVGAVVYSGIVAGSTRHPAAHTTTTSATAAPLPADLHGLSAREYPLVEAVAESEGRTIPELTAQGMTDDRIRALTDAIIPQAEKACAATAQLDKGFDNPSYKASFVAGYIATSKSTPEAAGKVYDAIAVYCAAG